MTAESNLDRIAIRERGATAVFIAAVLLVLMAMVSLAVDASLGFNERRDTQNAADLAALAAAWEGCNPEISPGDPQAAGHQAAQDNGYTHDPVGDTQVDVDPAGPDTWNVRISQRNDTTFGRATPDAPDELTVVSEATAKCVRTGILGGYAAFAGGTGCSAPEFLTQPGSMLTITGDVHSNEDISVQGSWTVTGDVTWRGSGPSGSGSADFGPPLDYPEPLASLSTSDYQLGNPRADAADSQGEYHSFSSTVGWSEMIAVDPANTDDGTTLSIGMPGIYYTPGTIDITHDIQLVGPAATAGVTFVAGDRIHLRGVGNARGYDPLLAGSSVPIFLFAAGGGPMPCSTPAIIIETDSATWTGVMYAPNAPIDIRPGTTTSGALNGSAIGMRTSFGTGVQLSLTYQDDPNIPPTFEVELLE